MMMERLQLRRHDHPRAREGPRLYLHRHRRPRRNLRPRCSSFRSRCVSFPFFSTSESGTDEDARTASKHMIDTGAGVIDADYRGEVKVLLFNHAKEDFAGSSFPSSLLSVPSSPRVLD
jgi:hypothetical protein